MTSDSPASKPWIRLKKEEEASVAVASRCPTSLVFLFLRSSLKREETYRVQVLLTKRDFHPGRGQIGREKVSFTLDSDLSSNASTHQ